MSESPFISVRLPDNSTQELPRGSSGRDLAGALSATLADKVVLALSDGEACDLDASLTDGVRVELLKRNDPRVLSTLRHDTAHVLAQATKEIFPSVQITFGPSTESGFYYDFATETPLTLEDLARIEERMHEIVERDLPLRRELWSRERAVEYFRSIGEGYKAEHIASIPEDDEITVYRQGDWLDLCRGPHLPSTGVIGDGFKLTHIGGAYWRGDQNNEQLQRVYGTCFATRAELDEHMRLREEAEARDHRRLGPALGLFHIQEEATGSVFWHPRGWVLWREVEDYVRRRMRADGYVEVRTPQLIDRALWERSGHWDKYRENMFIAESENRTLAVKPMNCPGHVQIYRQRLTSYRDLPIRMAEFGACHRNEPSGALHGIMRVRAFTQDDAHIFCTEEQIGEETDRFCRLLRSVYEDFGFSKITIKFADRPQVRAGGDEIWDKAEDALREAARGIGLPFSEDPGEGAFYGPKLDFFLQDALKRTWQCGTFQCDFVLPERLGASYVGADGLRKQPAMLHRTILGSLERFIAILIESTGGALPLWLSPVQVVIATITDRADAWAEEVQKACRSAGLRVETDTRNEKISYKIREHSEQKIPCILALGAREVESREVSLRRLGDRKTLTMSLAEAVSTIAAEALPPDLSAPSVA
ncbi:MAG: threonine--tRNA ligase [Alphaproteobacteria bacterium]